MNNNSLFSSLKNFNRKELRKTTTTVTTAGGVQLIETRCGDGEFTQEKKNVPSTYGFVVDQFADFQVGEILPGLILGSQDVAADEEILAQHKVTHVLNVATFIKNLYTDKYIYKAIDILDIPQTHIIPVFDESFEFINLGRQNGCVLVHCNAGVSRSATIVIAYLMKTYGLPLQMAYNHVKQKRPKISPNAGFQVQLETYEERLIEAGVIHPDKHHGDFDFNDAKVPTNTT